jgi:4-azaleucine resistance transporter AzlC
MMAAPAMTDPDATSPFRRRDGLVVAFAVGVFGIAFGVLAVATGLSAPQAQVMSLLVFTGGSQFAAVGVIDAGGTPLAAVGSAALLAARNGMYGLSLNSILPRGFRRRAVAAQFVIDESAAMASAQQDRAEAQRAFWTTGLGVLVFWNLGTLLGAVGGNAIGDPETFGLDAAFPAGFVALMAPHLRQRPGLVAAIVGGLIALVTIPLVPAGVPILLATFGVIPAYVLATR